MKFAGLVAAVGENVESVKVGDRVLGLTRFGAYASHLNVSPKYLRPCPDDWTYAEAAAYSVQVSLRLFTNPFDALSLLLICGGSRLDFFLTFVHRY